jgi:hypothetical protein
MDTPNPGIKCQVKACYYYLCGDCCTADRIEVLPKDAADSRQTDCGTFAPKH